MSGNCQGPNRGVGIGRFKRAMIIACYDRRCWICGNRPETLTLDHVIPRVDGGGVAMENLRPACPRCNTRRAARLDAMAGRGRRHAISLDLANTWWQKHPLPRFNEQGQVEWIDPDLRRSLPAHLQRVSYGRPQKELAAGSSASDFREPLFPNDRVLALRAAMEAKGDALPKPPVCHGYANCCRCPACEPSKHRKRRAIAA